MFAGIIRLFARNDVVCATEAEVVVGGIRILGPLNTHHLNHPNLSPGYRLMRTEVYIHLPDICGATVFIYISKLCRIHPYLSCPGFVYPSWHVTT